ncbi:MAG: alpha-2-macroglobulin family protein, partial [Pyrinomonadaceae bacterium]
MKKLTAWALLLSTWFTFVAPAGRLNAQVTGRAMENKMKDVPNGLTFRLSEGTEGAEKRVKTGLPSTDPLSQTDANGILKRLPDIKSDPNDQTDFAKRIGTLPAPKTGNKIPVKFPSDDMRAAPAIDMSGKTLEVLRYSPEGEVTLAPDLSITFSQPMVAVTSQQQAAEYAPVELTPQVPGRWRWLGTKTLMFDTDKRFPMATKFTARVPAGTKSANGQALQKDMTWTFTTPPPKVEQMWPANQTVRRDALMYLQFDQAITPEAVLRTISVMGGGRGLQTRLATQAEIDADSTVSYYTKQAQPGRWLAFRAINSEGGIDALPGATGITVDVQKGTPSAEGPLTTAADQTFSFRTYGPLKFNRGYCNYESSKVCSPYDTWYLEFNNAIDGSKFDKSMIHVEPAIEGLTFVPSGQYIYISGVKKGNTTYKVTIDPTIADIFGQKLGTTVTATFRVGRAEAELSAQGGTMTVLDPTAKQTFSIYSTNYSNVKVRLYAVRPEDWRAFQDYLRHINYDDSSKRPEIPGRLVSDDVVEIANKPDEMVETRIDVAKALNGGFGNVIVDIEPTIKKDKYDRTRIFQWLQSTQIGLDAYVDSDQLVGFATEMRTGRPMADVDLFIYPNGKSVSLNGSDDSGKTPEGVTLTSVATAVWDWVTGQHSSAPSEVTATDESGSAIDAETVPEAQTNRTGDNGILRLPLPDTFNQNGGPNMLIARRGKDVAFLPENSEYYYNDQGSWYKKPQIDQLRWFTFDDRKMYKPKEEVSVKGYIRTIQAGKLGDVAPIGAAKTYYWSAKDPRNNEIGKGQITTNAFGAFDLKFKLPDNTNLGYARVDFSTEAGVSPEYSHQFQIQEFRRPEFEVSAKVESEAPFFVGDKANVSVQASYYAGGGLANAETNWTVTATPTNYSPPNHDDFNFGMWTPWWGWYDYGEGYGGRGGYGGGSTQTFKGVTDAGGKHLLKMDFVSANPPRPYAISAAASVQDVNRQTWSSSTSLLVHPSSLYVGMKTPRTFVQKGEKISMDSLVTDIDGQNVTGRDVEIKAVLKDWDFEKGSWVEKVVDEQTCNVKSGEKPQTCDFVAKQGGRYTITATVMDDKERYNESEMTVWVPGGKTPPKRNVEQEQVQIIPSKKEYQPGDVAELLVIAPFTPAEGVLTLRRDGIVKTERFSMRDSSITLKVPIDPKYLPNVTAQIDLVGAADRTDDKGEVDPKLAKRPAFASGTLGLSISTASRHLTVSAEPTESTLAPGAETKVNIDVKDSRGEPVANSEVALIVVDESVLALSRYTIADPLDTFYSQRGTGTTDYHLRQQVLLANPGDIKKVVVFSGQRARSNNFALDGMESRAAGGVMRAAPAPMSKAMNMAADEASVKTEEKDKQPEQPDPAIALRANFDALAMWSPTVKTDSNGHAVIPFKLPDNLTRYRITAVSVDSGNRFGKAESNITAKQPLMVRPSAPRFMNFGDHVELPIVVQNQTDKDMAVDVAIRATNASLGVSSPHVSKGQSDAEVALPNGRATDTDGRRVMVKANDRVEVRFPVSTVKAGTARFQIAVSSGAYTDAAEISLPVWTPATTEAFATYGNTDQNGAIVQPVQTPGDVFPQFGGLEVTTSSTQLQELTDAYISLYRYPYECSEQISSRMISIAAMRDVLDAFKAKEMPSKAEIESQFKRDIEILQSRQRDDGSFGLWKRDKE